VATRAIIAPYNFNCGWLLLSQKQKRAHWLFSGTSLHKDLERCKESMALVTHLDETQFGNSWIVGQITQKPTKTKQTTQLKNTPNKNTNSKQKTNVMNTQTRVHAGGTNKRAHKHITTTRTIISQLMLCASHLRGLRADVALCEGGAVLRPTCVAPSIYLGSGQGKAASPKLSNRRFERHRATSPK